MDDAKVWYHRIKGAAELQRVKSLCGRKDIYMRSEGRESEWYRVLIGDRSDGCAVEHCMVAHVAVQLMYRSV